jgi:hypothetical protein
MSIGFSENTFLDSEINHEDIDSLLKNIKFDDIYN